MQNHANTTTLLLTNNIKMDGMPTKIKWKIHPLLHCISSFEGTSLKKWRYSHQIFYFLLFYISFYIRERRQKTFVMRSKVGVFLLMDKIF